MLKVQIQAALKLAGLPENLFGLIKVEAEDKITEAVTALKGALPANLLTVVGKVNKTEYTTQLAFLTDLSVMASQVESDRRVTEALAKNKTETEAKAEAERLRIENEKVNKDLTPDQLVIKELRESNKVFMDFIKEQKTASTKNTQAEKARAILKEKKLNEKWADKLDLSEGAPDLDTQISDLNELITGTKQDAANEDLDKNKVDPEDSQNVVSSETENLIKSVAIEKNIEDGTATKPE